MAVEYKLSITYLTESGDTTTHNYKFAKTNVTTSQVQALITATITNGVIFSKAPAIAKRAKLVATDTSEFDIS